MQVLYETAVGNPIAIGLSKQIVHIPTTFFGVRSGSYTRQIKGIQAKGSVMIREDWGAETAAQFGVCRHAHREIMCIRREGDEHWVGIDARPVEKGTSN